MDRIYINIDLCEIPISGPFFKTHPSGPKSRKTLFSFEISSKKGALQNPFLEPANSLENNSAKTKQF